MTLAEFAISSPSNSQVNSAQLESTETSQTKLFSHDSPLLVSQLVTPQYACTIAVYQPNATPPIANYNASINCSVGIPSAIALSVSKSNVNFPNNRISIGTNSHSCSTSSSCNTPTYTRNIDRTQLLWVAVGFNILGSDGKIYQRTDFAPVFRPYNDRGASYPLIQPTRSDMAIVPFPMDPPYVERVPRVSTFADELRKIYVAKNWTIPPSPAAHHIKPLAWGGGNDPSINGVFLGPTTHQQFTTWWASFSNLNW